MGSLGMRLAQGSEMAKLRGSLVALSLVVDAAATDSFENLTFRIGGGRWIAVGLLPVGLRGPVRGETEKSSLDALAEGPADSSENLTLWNGDRS